MKSALVTGANKSIGFEVARQLAQKGVYVYLGSRNLENGLEAVNKLKADGLNNVEAIGLDITNDESVKNARVEIGKKTKVLDILINNAGIYGGYPQEALDVTIDQFKATYDAMSNTEFVNAIYANAGILPSQAKRDSLVSALDSNSESRSAVLLEVAADAGFRQKEQNAAFVLMQYFGYLRRDPDAGGYDFWLNVLDNKLANDTSGYRSMVCAFVTSAEYQSRFGMQVTRSNSECER